MTSWFPYRDNTLLIFVSPRYNNSLKYQIIVLVIFVPELTKEQICPAMKHKRQARYSRIRQQLKEILSKNDDLFLGMATINAILYHKMDGFFWVGFYLLKDGRLLVGPYQGPVACIELPGNKGVCWAGINGGVPVIVPDVHEYPGHIACDPRSKSETVIPVRDRNN